MGDAVILKVACFGGFEPSDSTRQLLASLPRRPPDFSKHDFSKFPPRSLGREYFAFMQRNGLKPFGFSGNYQELLERNFFAVWYAAVHDLVHVLTGFDTTLKGEAGVWAFVAGQKIAPQADRAVSLARALYPLVNPLQGKQIRAAIKQGYRMGGVASSIVSIPLDQELANPLAEVRQRYRIQLPSPHSGGRLE